MKPTDRPQDSSDSIDVHEPDGESGNTRALVLVPDLESRPKRVSPGETESPMAERSAEARLEEAVGLAAAIDLDVVGASVVRVANPRPATLFGSGKVDDLGAIIATEEVALVIIDHPVTPIQQRNLEKAWKVKVLDRTALILEIFGARARTREGRLQVELAHLRYQKSRLVRSWTHLERQRGGFGFLGGPGETQIEADRRLIQERISRLEKDLEQVRRTRALHRRQRKKVPQPVVALVGYTNAGKSTLFNTMTRATVYAEDQLFATLDPTLRRIGLPHGGEAILSDTVGFVSDLPTHLVAAFRATLEEVVEADIILHVRDISHADTMAQAQDVSETLALLDIDSHDTNRIVEVWNKVDLLDADQRERLIATADKEPPARVSILPVSALTGEGVPRLLAAIEARLTARDQTVSLTLPAKEGALLAWLYRHTDVLERREEGLDLHLTVRVSERQAGEFRRRYGPFLTDEPHHEGENIS